MSKNYNFHTDVRIGERLYTFYHHKDIDKAIQIYAYFLGNQNEFETKMVDEDIEFYYADQGNQG